MKYVIRVILFSIIYCGTAQAATINKKILSLPITTISGENLTLDQYRGKKPIYIKFWATWCQPCRKQMPHFQHTQKKFGDKVKVIAVNLGMNDSLKLIKKTKNEFGLTMSIAIDKSGILAQSFKLIGTPLHVLIDKNGTIVHTGFKASREIDKKIQLLASNKTTDIPDISLLSLPKSGSKSLVKNIRHKNTVLFFVATWCDWYLKESRPTMSKKCINAQLSINHLYKKYPEYNWVGLASRLWTGNKELAKYKKKFTIIHPISVDTSNEGFFTYKVKDFPTLIMISNGKEVFRVKDFNDLKGISNKLKQLGSM